VDLKIDTPQLRELLAEAVMASMDQVKREALIQGAVQHLLAKSNDSYNRTSPIEQAFQYAVRDVATKLANDMLTNDKEVEAKLRGLVNEALERLMTTNREATVTKLADAIAAGMAYRSRD
jgi:BMFP domain-containing protein YqiC